MSCCPADSWPGLKTDYVPKGQVVPVEVDGGASMEVYIAKPESGECASDLVIVWFYDIGGANQGRTKAMCDTFANVCGCEVLLPDVYLGDATDWSDIPAFLKKFPTTVANPRYVKALELAQQGGRKIAMIGTCWGTLPMMSLCADLKMDAFLCGGCAYCCCCCQYLHAQRCAAP